MPVEVAGVIEARKVLRKLAPDILKAYNAQIAVPLKEIRNDARSNVPPTIANLSNYNSVGYERKSRTSRERAFPSYEPGVIRSGLTYSLAKSRANRSGWVSLVSMLNKSASGAIVETAGRKNPYGSPDSQSNNPLAGESFINSLNNGIGELKQTGKTEKTKGRLMGAAVVDNQGKAQATVLKILEQVSQAANNEIARFKRGN